MNDIKVLNQTTIDKIAAGEVVERPASVVKELAENAIDAKADNIVVEIQDGGITSIRITDNGSGIPGDQVENAFLRHATSKIREIDDLHHILSLGFRGEALSSIASVAKMEVISKTADAQSGVRYVVEGGKEQTKEEVGAPQGTTFTVRQLFYNTPARRKFLKTAVTEAGHIYDLLVRLALSNPSVSFTFLNRGQEKLHTAGNGDLRDTIYRIYGREIVSELLQVNYKGTGFRIQGYIGSPVISRGNRNFEHYDINGRYVKGSMLAKAIEDAYKDYTMQHRYPFTVLHIQVDTQLVDVNVHPTKMEVRFQNQQQAYNAIYEAIHGTLLAKEQVPQVQVPDVPQPSQEVISTPQTVGTSSAPSTPKRETIPEEPEDRLSYFMEKMKERVSAYHHSDGRAEVAATDEVNPSKMAQVRLEESVRYRTDKKPEQLDLFRAHVLKEEEADDYRLIGQIFDTYWLVQYQENLYIIDQHAAHERVLYERTMASMKSREYTSQIVSPPLMVSLSMQEMEVLRKYETLFTDIGFELEPFGEDSYAIRAVPDNLFSISKSELFIEILDQLADSISSREAPDIIAEKVASMSCKAAVKGRSSLSAAEMDALIRELLTLENPYHCPHGRPTIIAMSRRELEKKFKRIV